MDFNTILAIVKAATASAEQAAALVSAARTVFTSDQQGEIDAAMQQLAAANDQLHERVQDKLAAAAQSD